LQVPVIRSWCGWEGGKSNTEDLVQGRGPPGKRPPNDPLTQSAHPLSLTLHENPAAPICWSNEHSQVTRDNCSSNPEMDIEKPYLVNYEIEILYINLISK
jgi:hypothetical protein